MGTRHICDINIQDIESRAHLEHLYTVQMRTGNICNIYIQDGWGL